jgi:PAS domain S-box-containing protein
MLPLLSVLVVEDVPADAELICEQLRRDGHRVEWSRVDTEADFRASLNPRLDAILSDCKLPSFSASRALEIVRESGLDVPFILVSGTIGEEAATALIREGAADYVSKDRLGRLSTAVSRAMADAHMRREQAHTIDNLRRAEARFRGLFESKVIGIVVADKAGLIREANSFFLSMVGHSAADLPLDWVAMTPQEFRSLDSEALRDLETDGGAALWEKEFIGRDGNRVPIMMGGARLPDDSLVCFIVDLTQIKAAQAGLEHAKSELEAAMHQLRQTQDAVIAEERLHALGQMAAGIAHDFNNSLNPIIGLSELILRQPDLIQDHDKVLNYVRTIHQAGTDAALVVSRLRDYYRDDDGQSEVEIVDLKRVVEQTIELTQSRWRDQAMATNTKYKIVTKLDDASVAGHASELREMLVNLIFNALDAMPNGGDLWVAVERNPDRPGIVNLEVKDTGVGMTPEVRKRCLEPFFTTKGAAGTGLGLATAYGIVKRHHGEIQIESEPGRGTRMIVTLPIADSSHVSAARQEVPPPRAMRILVIDDEEDNRYLIAEYLGADGHEVDTADGPVDGLRKIKEVRYDLIITDRAMPEMSGDQLALEAKRIAPRVPILMLTGFGDFMNTADERPEGVDVVVGKPVRIDALRDAIAMATGATRELTPAS